MTFWLTLLAGTLGFWWLVWWVVVYVFDGDGDEGVLAASGATFIMLILILCAFAIRDEGASYERFVAECSQDRKHYECEALWRSSQPNTVIMPAPIVVR